MVIAFSTAIYFPSCLALLELEFPGSRSLFFLLSDMLEAAPYAVKAAPLAPKVSIATSFFVLGSFCLIFVVISLRVFAVLVILAIIAYL